MPQSLLLWGMLLKENDFLMDLEQERLLRKETRIIDLPKAGRQHVEAFALVWNWYDRVLSYRHSAGEDQITQNWQACMDEENLNASDALVRLVYVYAQGAERLGLGIADEPAAVRAARKHQAAWRARNQRHQH